MAQHKTRTHGGVADEFKIQDLTPFSFLEVIDADGNNQMDFFVGGKSAFRVYRLSNDTIFRDGFG